ncbi:zinc-binding dehydrogenase [Actinacidiphila acidipaludis]|uniref:Zinc-binding dehydrogenase n=1 Tax=Actinacidiphila acidipaludis TaxID=2873382 RepID=A0ABS7QG26_9ACTN|nr:zinc-binding dehydrogenase [Streptomyces acidipaludis]MBY8882116.1 zinc-binding dehydrogenase [Streptomyces acidipaludis]
MRAVRVSTFGPPDVLRIEEAPEPAPAVGEVLVDVELAGVGYGDVIVRSGRYPFPRPYVPGLEVGGIVAAVGPGVDPALTGRRVVATTTGMTGGYAERALASAGDVHEVPRDLPLDRAVAVFQAGAVAVGLLSAIRLRRGETVLITAAAGRIGSLLVQRARSAGAGLVVAAVGSAEKAAAAREFGAHVVVDHRTEDWAEQVRAATGGRGTDVTLDAVGDSVGAEALAATADGGGRFGLYGFTSGSWVELDAYQIGRRGISVVGALGIAFAKPHGERRADAAGALRAAAAGELAPRIHGTYALEDAAEAHTVLEKGGNIGALLLTTGRP